MTKLSGKKCSILDKELMGNVEFPCVALGQLLISEDSCRTWEEGHRFVQWTPTVLSSIRSLVAQSRRIEQFDIDWRDGQVAGLALFAIKTGAGIVPSGPTRLTDSI